MMNFNRMDPEKLQKRGQQKMLKFWKEINKKNDDQINLQVRHIMKLKGVKMSEIKTRQDQKFEIILHESTDNFHETRQHVLETCNDLQEKFPFLDLHIAKVKKEEDIGKVIIRVFWGDYLTLVMPKMSAPSKLHSAPQLIENFDATKQENARRLYAELEKVLQEAEEHKSESHSDSTIKLVDKTMDSPITRQHFQYLRLVIQNEYPYVETYRIKLNTVNIRVHWGLYFQYVQLAQENPQITSLSSSSSSSTITSASKTISTNSEKINVEDQFMASQVLKDAYAMKQSDHYPPSVEYTTPSIYPQVPDGELSIPKTKTKTKKAQLA